MKSGALADSLIEELVQRYAAISTYRDRGVVLQALREGGAPIETSFETRFRRPGMFRFAFSNPHPFPPLAHILTQHCCGADSLGAYSWTKQHDESAYVEGEEDLSMAVAGATGISGGSAHTIGGLLMPEIGGFTLDRIRGSRVLCHETFEGAECIVVRAPHPVSGELSLWVDYESMTLRKLMTDHGSFPPGEEIRREIEINAIIQDHEVERPV